MSPALALVAALGGGLGACLRYLVDVAVARRCPGPFPVATFGINVVGSFALGVLIGLMATNDLAMALLGAGLLGGFTTMSTASYDAVRLARSGERAPALLYVTGTLVVAVAAAAVGSFLTGGFG